MSKKSTIVVAFSNGGIIPARILEKPKDVSVLPHEPIEVPKVYGDHLIFDRIAYDFVEAEKRKKADAASAAKHAEAARSDTEALEALNEQIARLVSENERLTADLDEADKALADERDRLGKELEAERNNVAMLTEQLAEATKPPVQEQETLKMDGDGGKSK
ncbi:septal ring factor EnvC (AmiA/AmiB activator) [Ochrobactrum daejeonense]|uniref:Septal ring factor EnvC (AmiA/AmiB activator) n=1 Tax=Brucella daejeonensis TaxID=659015 RepID=A0A7W9AZQ8_9HYPH|nr:hypothetical protein [Brucella daejeonensis]MBB5703600.1 septal ring factor EnvC (AmiA/AmiB activator) [Brucella daejeonensis]NKB79849.1 hypothetical protein [Brucella daejeonensis]